MAERPSWDDYFMQIAHLVKTRATCPRRQVGAVIVRERRILATGYNGAPRGLQHCPDGGPEHDWPRGCMKAGHCIRSLHAEQNALLQAAMIGIACQGATMYVTCQPCNTCAKMIINAGIERVIYEGDYPDDFSLELFRESKLQVQVFSEGQLKDVDLVVR
ncbi:MAG: dCMP deaminase family protein [Fimbriimonadaceae bacterium]|nr:MAG: riboflavin biosynthesis protein RibD [Armatimonadetes bacterium OLB18]MCZ7580111.1 dCMP deaminase family protein [Fimbriimonadaceae bacterium]WKZ81330.1 MAG: dCMP deaminase family protein [Fimbriimonadaceae bacterium]